MSPAQHECAVTASVSLIWQNLSVASEWAGHMKQRQQVPCAALFTAKLKNLKHYLTRKKYMHHLSLIPGHYEPNIAFGMQCNQCIYIYISKFTLSNVFHASQSTIQHIQKKTHLLMWCQKRRKVLIVCFIPHFKGRSWSVPINCARLGLKFHLSKQKKIWYRSSNFLSNEIMEEISHLREFWRVHAESILH